MPVIRLTRHQVCSAPIDERPVGPHIDQAARDGLDDFGLVAVAGTGPCVPDNSTEVVG